MKNTGELYKTLLRGKTLIEGGVNTYDRDKAVGDVAEDEVLAMVQEKYPEAYRVEGYKKEWDIVIPEIGMTMEVKDDFMCAKTGNCFIEVGCKGRPSGLKTTEAEFWTICTAEEFILIKPCQIWEIIEFHGLMPEKYVSKDNSDEVEAYLVKKEHILQNCTKFVIRR